MDLASIMKEDFIVVLDHLSKEKEREDLPKGCKTSKKVFDKFNETQRVPEEDVENYADLHVATLSYLIEELEKSPKATVIAMNQTHNGRKIKDAFLDKFAYNFQTQEGIFFSNVLKNAIANASIVS